MASADAGVAARAVASPAASEEFRRLAEHSADVIARHDATGRLVYVSPAVQALLGYDPAFVTGRYLNEFLHPDDVARVTDAHRRVVAGDGLITVTYRIRHLDGHYVWFETTSRDRKSVV